MKNHNSKNDSNNDDNKSVLNSEMKSNPKLS